ncbi:MAG: hypothetical protein QF464_13150, partial [Myxococcota bacterium]|nr:hypothetical protein [Myxococcota bacterium]
MSDSTEEPREEIEPSLLARALSLKLNSVSDHDQRAFLLREYVKTAGPDGAVRGLHVLIKSAMRGEHRGAWVAVAIAICAEALPYDMMESLYRAARKAELDIVRLLMVGGNACLKTARDGEFGRDDFIENLTLGERKAKARLRDRNALDRLLYDPEPSVVRILLGNPRLTEDHVLKLASRRPNRAAALAEIARDPRWLSRGTIQRALALNPYTPIRITLTLLPLFSVQELHELSQ